MICKALFEQPTTTAMANHKMKVASDCQETVTDDLCPTNMYAEASEQTYEPQKEDRPSHSESLSSGAECCARCVISCGSQWIMTASVYDMLIIRKLPETQWSSTQK